MIVCISFVWFYVMWCFYLIFCYFLWWVLLGMNWTFVYNVYFMCVLCVFVLEFVFYFDIMLVFLSFMYIKMKIYNVLWHVNQFRVDTDTTTESKTDFISYNKQLENTYTLFLMRLDFVDCVIKKVFYKLLNVESTTHRTHNIKWLSATICSIFACIYGICTRFLCFYLLYIYKWM